jgi:hypothetical protein
MRWALCSLAFVAACASASLGTDKPIDASTGDDDDAPRPIDAPPPIDAPVMATLSETVNSNVSAGLSLACFTGTNNQQDTNYYRVFQLSDFSITGVFHVQSLAVAIEESAGNVTATFNIGTYAGAIDAATLNMGMYAQLATTTFPIPVSASAENIVVPLVADIPAGSKFLVFMAIPSQSANQHYALIGATTSGETHPGYYSSNTCGTAIETSVALGSTGQWILNVVGTH